MSDTAQVALVAACLTFLSAGIAALVSLWVSARTRYINAVTAQRSEWIEKLRINIAKYSGTARSLHYKISKGEKAAASQEYDALILAANDLIPLIRLQLNPFGKADQNFLRIINQVALFAEKEDSSGLDKADDLLIRHAQWLLKAEWEKVKSESRGVLSRPGAWVKTFLYNCRYRKFCEGEGSLSAVEGNTPRENGPSHL